MSVQAGSVTLGSPIKHRYYHIVTNVGSDMESLAVVPDFVPADLLDHGSLFCNLRLRLQHRERRCRRIVLSRYRFRFCRPSTDCAQGSQSIFPAIGGLLLEPIGPGHLPTLVCEPAPLLACTPFDCLQRLPELALYRSISDASGDTFHGHFDDGSFGSRSCFRRLYLLGFCAR